MNAKPLLLGCVLLVAMAMRVPGNAQQPVGAKTHLKVGDVAPDFTLPDQNRKPVNSQAQNAQPTAAVKRNVLLKQDLNIPGFEAVMVSVDLPPGSAEGRHTHPAEAYAFVQEGSIFLEVAGKPDATLKVGDIFYIASGQVHQASNKSNVPAKLAVVFVAEKGKPLTTKAE